jgi:hypothetical protein
MSTTQRVVQCGVSVVAWLVYFVLWVITMVDASIHPVMVGVCLLWMLWFGAMAAYMGRRVVLVWRWQGDPRHRVVRLLQDAGVWE